MGPWFVLQQEDMSKAVKIIAKVMRDFFKEQ